MEMRDPVMALPLEVRKHARKRAQPFWFSPMLATLVDEPFSRDDWIFEAKLDGERCLIFRNGKKLKLVSRNRKSLNKTYPELVAPLSAAKAAALYRRWRDRG